MTLTHETGCFVTIATITLFTLLYVFLHCPVLNLVTNIHRRKRSSFSVGRRLLSLAVIIFMVLATIYCVTSLLAYYKSVSGSGVILTAFEGTVNRPDEVAAMQKFVRIWEAVGSLIVSSHHFIARWISDITVHSEWLDSCLESMGGSWSSRSSLDSRCFSGIHNRYAVILLGFILTVYEVTVAVDLSVFYSMNTQSFISQHSAGKSNLMVYIPLLFTNIVSTLIIFWKTWFVFNLSGKHWLSSVQDVQERSPTLPSAQHETNASGACTVSPDWIRLYLLRVVGKSQFFYFHDRTQHIKLDSSACHQFVP